MTEDMQERQIDDLWQRTRIVYISMLQTPEERSQVDRYFGMISSVKSEGDILTFYTTNAAAADLLARDYKDKIENCLKLVGGPKDLRIAFKYDDSQKATIVIPPSPEKASQESTQSDRRVGFISTMPLREEYNFDEFVEGPSNSWAYSAAKGVVSHPGEKGYNPLFIHGGTGLGKTHLMQAIGNELMATRKNIAVCYLTAETFLNEYVNSLQNGVIGSFREKYRNIDVLLVDDVQFLQKGKNFQEEFFNTFQFLQDKNKQIVMTCDVAPKNLPALEARLVSRFIGGMVQEIESPSYETRLAILKKKTEGQVPRIPVETLEFIAENIKSHVRAMEGALAKVRVIIDNNPRAELSPLVLSRLLKDFIDNEQTLKKMTIEEIQTAVAQKFNVTMKDIISAERTQSLVTPRQMAMYIARKFTSNSLEEIGSKFGKKHATILHGVKTIEKRLDVESNLRAILEQILAEFGVNPLDGKNL